MESTAIKEIKGQIKTYKFKVDYWRKIEDEQEERTNSFKKQGREEHSLLEYKRIADNWEEANSKRVEARRWRQEYELFVNKLSVILNYLEDDEDVGL